MESQLVDRVREALPDYVVIRELGRGAFGVVLLARDPRLGRLVAIKVMNPAQLDPRILGRFRREAQSCARLSHPNLVTIHDADLAGGVPYLVLDFVEGTDLNTAFQEGIELDAIPMSRDLAGGLAHLHAKGILHRDIKPPNIMIRSDGRPVLMDLGLAKEPGSDQTMLTEEGALLGTPLYMAPEILRGVDAGMPSDVYSLGQVIYEIVVGRRIFHGREGGIQMPQRLARQIPPLRTLVPGVDPVLEALIHRCLSDRPADRPTAQELHQSLSDMAEIERDTKDFRALGWVKRKASQVMRSRGGKRSVTGALVILGGMLGVLGIGFWVGKALQRPVPPRTPSPVPSVEASAPALPARFQGSDGGVMVLVPGGFALLGAESRRIPVKAFYIDVLEVTNEQYSRFRQATGHRPPVSHDAKRSPVMSAPRHPVVGVTAADAGAYCAWKGKRLPTGKEWEKAARGKDGRTYPWGEETSGNPPVNFRDSSNIKATRADAGSEVFAGFTPDDGYPFTAPVGSYPAGASPYGVLDLAGNVAEICIDDSVAGGKVVDRGGSWRSGLKSVKALEERTMDPDSSSETVGFRCACAPEALAAVQRAP